MSDFSLGLLGYNRAQVDGKLQEQQELIDDLQNQIQTLQDQLSEYQAMENILKDSILDARKTGNEIIETSTLQADALVDRVNLQVTQYKDDITMRSQRVIESGISLKEEMNAMKDEFRAIVNRFNDLIDDTDFDVVYPDASAKSLTKELDRFNESESLALSEETTDKATPTPEDTLTEEEKANLQKLIHEVLTNESAKSQTESNRDLRVIRSK